MHPQEKSRESGWLVTAGEFFLDLIFYDLPELPRLGEELKTDSFAFALGGGAAITAAAASRLGQKVQIMTVWGNSPMDEAAQRRLKEWQVGTSWSKVYPGMMSGLTVSVSTREDRYFLTHMGANSKIEEFLLGEAIDFFRQARHVHFALTPANWGGFQRLVESLKGQGVTTSWDLGWSPEAAASQGFAALCGGLDVLFFNEMEGLRFAGAETVEAALDFFSRPGNTVVIKRGSRGAMARRNRDEEASCDVVEVDAVDSTGAGDAFDGGFLTYWMSGQPLGDCLLAGNVCGGLSTRRPGGTDGLPDRTEFEREFERALQKGAIRGGQR